VANGFFRADADLSEARFDAYRSPENMARRERAAELGDRRGLTMTQVALAWVLNQPVSAVASIGTRSADHLAEAVAAAAIKLSAADLHWLEHGGDPWAS
jgi:aryl-alcohol dehydrogenase-like predicted oxidoreductase